MSKAGKVNLDLMKMLLSELEKELDASEVIRSDEKGSANEYVLKVSRASGIASGMMQEASLIVMDLAKLALMAATAGQSQSQDSKSVEDLVNKAVGKLGRKLN